MELAEIVALMHTAQAIPTFDKKEGIALDCKCDDSSADSTGDITVYKFGYYLTQAQINFKIGFAIIEVPKTANKTVYWKDFFPYKFAGQQRFKRLGDVAHIKTLNKLIELTGNLDGYKLAHTTASEDRVNQLRDMGIKISPGGFHLEDFSAYFAKSSGYCANAKIEVIN